jgi:hypothetical protein
MVSTSDHKDVSSGLTQLARLFGGWGLGLEPGVLLLPWGVGIRIGARSPSTVLSTCLGKPLPLSLKKMQGFDQMTTQSFSISHSLGVNFSALIASREVGMG